MTDSFLLLAEVACTPDSFAGLVFRAADSDNFELVYISADNQWDMPNLQYDPVMNGSSTWQIYHGPRYQALVPVPSEQWVKLSLKVQPNGFSVYIGDTSEPSLILPNFMHGGASGGKIGIWGSSNSYMRNLFVEEIPAEPLTDRAAEAAAWRVDEDYSTQVTEWLVSLVSATPERASTKVMVEENGTLNLNRLFASEKGAVAHATCSFYVSEEIETVLSFGFSDHIRLWVNEQEVFEGDWTWHSPGQATDGRIRSDHIRIPIHWKAGMNTIQAEVTSMEVMFGWGLSVRTGLSGLSFE